MTNGEALKVLEISQRIFKEVKGFKFNKAIVDAEEQLEKIKKAVERIHEPTSQFKEYQKKYQETALKYCKKDASGQPMVDTIPVGNGQYVYDFKFDPKRESARKKALEEIEKPYQNDIKKQEKKEVEYRKALKEDSGYKKIAINEKEIPADLSTEQTRLVFKLFNVK